MHRGPLRHSWTPWSEWWSRSEHKQCPRCRGRCWWTSQFSLGQELQPAVWMSAEAQRKHSTPFALFSCHKPESCLVFLILFWSRDLSGTLSRTDWMISFLLVASWVALALCSCCTTAVQERIPMQSSPNRQSSLTESGGEGGLLLRIYRWNDFARIECLNKLWNVTSI